MTAVQHDGTARAINQQSRGVCREEWQSQRNRPTDPERDDVEPRRRIGVDNGLTQRSGPAIGQRSDDERGCFSPRRCKRCVTTAAGNPALSLRDAAVCAGSPIGGVDQRGVARPQGAGCDLGAFEGDLAATAITGGRDPLITTGSIDLMWTPGTTPDRLYAAEVQHHHGCGRPHRAAGSGGELQRATASDGTVYCYVLAATGPSGLLGLSDLVCGLTGQQGGGVIAGSFALTLRQSTNALITWTAPVGGADSYLLVTIPLDGSPPTNTGIPGGATATLQPVISAGTCFQLVAFKGAAFGQANVLCGVPGVATTSARSGRTAGEALGDAVALFSEGVAGLTSRLH